MQLRLSHIVVILIELLLVLIPGGHAYAGSHEDGVILAHLAVDLEYSYGQTYENLSDIRDCQDAITSGDVLPDVAQIWYVLASFHKSPGPVNVKSIQFGFRDYDPSQIAIVDWGSDALLELPGADWPGPNDGTAITWIAPKTTQTIEAYWFASYVYGSVAIELGPDIFGEEDEEIFGGFADAGIPPIPDEAADYGIIGFGVSGYNPCSLVPETGACCIGESCEVMERSECNDFDGVYQGDKTDCFPRNPCVENTLPASWGKLKKLYRY